MLALSGRWRVLAHRSVPVLLAWVASALGLALRVEHALTFDGLKRGADYERHVSGVVWMMTHWHPFDFTPALDPSISYQSPLWYFAAALILKVTKSERAIASLAVAGWVVRQALLARILKQGAPARHWSALVALTVTAFMPISIQTDGELNPEVLHSTLFAAATYALWRMERHAQVFGRIGLAPAVAFGILAGLALLAKSTAAVLPLAATFVVGWRAWRMLRRRGWPDAWRRLIRPALLAGTLWCVVCGWWWGSNLVKYHHPFPHGWSHPKAEMYPVVNVPVLQRRPLEWALPFTWAPYWDAPIFQWASIPRPNLWAMVTASTWADSINRGFCRLKGEPVPMVFWDDWPITGPCLSAMATVFHLGVLISLATMLALARVGLQHLRAEGRLGSLALPVVAVLGGAFPCAFAWVYPEDGSAVVNARYLLPVSMAMAACLGLALAQLPNGRMTERMAARIFSRLTHLVLLGASVTVAVLVTLERWGG
jgi:hypothetical protein